MKISACFAFVVLTPLILSFVVVESAVSNLSSFTFLGNGFCQDSQSNSYDYVVYYLVANEEACATNCVGLISLFGQGSVVGMEYSLNQTVCYCDLDNLKLTSQPSSSGGWFHGYEGTGLPIMGNGNPEYPFQCYSLARKPSPSKPVKPLPTKPTVPIAKPAPTRPSFVRPTKPTFTSSRFTYIGEGICMDSQNNYYDFVEYYNVATLEACAMTCSNLGTTYTSTSIVGMEYSASIKNCLCNFDNDSIPSQPVNSSDWYNENSGTGIPVKANSGFGDFNFTCYKRADTPSSPRRPARPPTRPARPTTRPARPTTPVKPTTSSQLLYVGEGSCLSALNQTYDWVLFYASPNVTDCTNQCTSLAASYTIGSLVGVEFYDMFKDCYCDFDNGRLTSTSQPSGSDEWNADNLGTGAPVRTNGGNGIQGWSCYKFTRKYQG